MYWLRARKELGKQRQARFASSHAVEYLSASLAGENLIMLGEIHHFPSVHQAVGDLLLQLKADYPNRRLVLFTEFARLPQVNPASRNTVATYYRRRPTGLKPSTLATEPFPYATRLFLRLLKARIEIYPLEDAEQQQVFAGKMLPEEDTGAFVLTERNKSWARVIEAKMAEIRQADPNALFVVYAGLGHTSWLMPGAMPKFFAAEHPAVVEITQQYPSDFSALRLAWGAQDKFFAPCGSQPVLYYWTGADARLWGKQAGFDYALIVPPLP